MRKAKVLPELLDELEGQEADEAQDIEIPKIEMSAVRSIAQLLENREDAYLDINKIEGYGLCEALIAHYMIESLDTDQAISYLSQKGPDRVRKMLLADLATQTISKWDCDPKWSLEALSVSMAGGVYHDFFSTMCVPMYLSEEERPTTRQELPRFDPEMDKAGAQRQVFRYFRGESFEAMSAAAGIAQYIIGADTRVCALRDVREIKELYGALHYQQLIRDEAIRADVWDKITSTTYPAKDVLIYSVLSLHKDFFSKMEGMDDGKARREK